MESKQVFVPRRSPRITGQARVQELIETSTEHDRVPELRRSPRIAGQARVREKLDMKNERKRQRRHELDSLRDLICYSSEFLREPNKAQ
ncbi:hypothetical protein MKW92_025334 [Papaver armeniacum]|nr:hypothetical protein MKW92_025334 [Papaver armeniacum]